LILARIRVCYAALAIVAGSGAACTGKVDERYLTNRQWTDDMQFVITSVPLPPSAIERVRYKIVAQDKRTKEPIETGEGRLFASSRDKANTWDGLEKGAEPGTYYANLFYVTAGQWAVALEFRRDSTKRLERMDWTQDVRAEREPGS